MTMPKVCPGLLYCPPTTPVSFQVSFAPSLQGRRTGGVKLFSSDLADPYLVALVGVAEKDRRDRKFVGHPEAVDGSGWSTPTMTATPTRRSSGTSTNFLDYPLQNGIDFQMASPARTCIGSSGSEDGSIEPCPNCKIPGNMPRVVSSGEGLDAVGALSRLLNLGSGYSCNGQNGNAFT